MLCQKLFQSKNVCLHGLHNYKYARLKSTIFGLSSGIGKCGVAVIRVSGPSTVEAVTKISKFKSTPLSRYAHFKEIRHPITNDLIDKGLVLFFPEPASFTGEDVCEFQIHGGPAVIEAMLNALGSINNLRPAKPGEFTRRAFYNGKLDLTKVEGLADLIHSETEAQRKLALLQVNGCLSNIYQKWRTVIIKSISHLEAYIDFSEDENIEENVLDELKLNLNSLIKEIQKHLNDNRKGERLRNGVKAVILGAPNVGKSSFMNLICQKSISIVTNIEGTTRDIVESCYNIGGYPIVLADTAGLRKNTFDLIELEGINRAKNYAKRCDFIILIIDSLKFIETNLSYENYLVKYLNDLDLTEADILDRKLLTIFNKTDLISNDDFVKVSKFNLLSCKSNLGVDEILKLIEKNLEELCGIPSYENPVISQTRHRFLLNECLIHLEEFREIFYDSRNFDYAIAAQKLRFATKSLGQITGDVSTEEILDVIFKDFCIGK